jgi:hypothetical protein
VLAAADPTAIYVALIGGITTITTGALALLGVVITTRNQVDRARQDQLIRDLTRQVERLEHMEDE